MNQQQGDEGPPVTLESIYDLVQQIGTDLFEKLERIESQQKADAQVVVQCYSGALAIFKAVQELKGGVQAPKAPPGPPPQPPRPPQPAGQFPSRQGSSRAHAGPARAGAGDQPRAPQGSGSRQGGAAPRSRFPGQRRADTPPPERAVDVSEFALTPADAVDPRVAGESIGFGKHRDRTWGYLAEKHPDYLMWLVQDAVDQTGSMNPGMWSKQPAARRALWFLQHYQEGPPTDDVPPTAQPDDERTMADAASDDVPF